MVDFYQNIGKLTLGSRLRRLSENFTDQAGKIFELYDVGLDAKWFPVFRALMDHSPLTITKISEIIGHSHVSVSKIVKEMKSAGICKSVKISTDGRLNHVELSETGKAVWPKLQRQCVDVNDAVEDLLKETKFNLWEAISEMENVLAQKDMFTRIKETQQKNAAGQVKILSFVTKYAEDFKRLNVHWIEKYFELEPSDIEVLETPQSSIIDGGGFIFMAEYGGEIVGTCALLNMGGGEFELAKMAVDEKAQGKRIGYLLGEAVVNKAREFGAKVIWLETNSMLTPAINLYKKLGFVVAADRPTPYARCDVQMEIDFTKENVNE